MSGEIFGLIALAVMFCLLAVKRVDKNERLAIYHMGKLKCIGGPGFVFVLPFFQTSKTIDLRKRSKPLPEIKLPGIKQSSIVSGTFQYQVDDPLKAAANADAEIATRKEIESTLLHVLSTATIRDCLVERYPLENRTMDLVNRQTRAWGVKVSAISISDFPVHRKVIGQLLALISGPTAAELTWMIEQVAEQNANQVAEQNGIDHVLEIKSDSASKALEYKLGTNA